MKKENTFLEKRTRFGIWGGNKLILLICCLFLALFQCNVKASTAYVINGVTVHYDDFSSSPNECWEYANKMYNKIWGQRFNSTFSDSSNSLRNLSDAELTLTPTHLKNYITNAALGSALRICDSSYLHGSDGWGHSQIIVQKDSNGFTVFQGGLSASPYRNQKYYTWSQYCSSWSYAYIKYIKWPGAAAYSTDTTKPTIKTTYYSEVTSTSFRLCCVPTDNVGVTKVRIATWTTGDQSDLKWVDARSNGAGTWFYDIQRNDFTNKNFFISHIYVYDAAGNYCAKERTYTYDTTSPVIKTTYYSEITSTSFRICCVPTDNVGVTKVRIATWTTGDQSDLKWVTASSNGAGTWFVDLKRSDFKNKDPFISHIYVYDAMGNYSAKEVVLHNYAAVVEKATLTSDGATYKKCVYCSKISDKKTIYRPQVISLSSTSYKYDKKGKKPSVTVKDSNGNVISSENYDVVYPAGRINVGKYTVTVKFKGNYTGTVKKTFTISPAGTKITKLTALSKGFNVKWGKNTAQTTGYQVQYSTSSKFTAKKTKTVTVKKNTTTSASVKKLSKKKKYYVRVRTYKTVLGKNYYSGWSASKSVTTKK